MIDRTSRYHATPVLTVGDGRGGTQRLLDLREIPRSTGVLSYLPTASDRLDHLAWRYYRDPTRFWTICDAASSLDPLDVLVPGEALVIPPDK